MTCGLNPDEPELVESIWAGIIDLFKNDVLVRHHAWQLTQGKGRGIKNEEMQGPR